MSGFLPRSNIKFPNEGKFKYKLSYIDFYHDKYYIIFIFFSLYTVILFKK